MNGIIVPRVYANKLLAPKKLRHVSLTVLYFRAFQYAFELAKHHTMSHKLPDLYLKQAMFYEDEGTSLF